MDERLVRHRVIPVGKLTTFAEAKRVSKTWPLEQFLLRLRYSSLISIKKRWSWRRCKFVYTIRASLRREGTEVQFATLQIVTRHPWRVLVTIRDDYEYSEVHGLNWIPRLKIEGQDVQVAMIDGSQISEEELTQVWDEVCLRLHNVRKRQIVPPLAKSVRIIPKDPGLPLPPDTELIAYNDENVKATTLPALKYHVIISPGNSV